MAVTYFGLNDATPDNMTAAQNGYLEWNNSVVVAYTCPGTGKQNIRALEHWCAGTALITKHIRLGIYNGTGTTKLYELEDLVGSLTAAWVGLAEADAPPGILLDGGSNYVFMVTPENADTQLGNNDLGGNAMSYKAAAYGALPTSLPTPDGYVPAQMCIRCGVGPIIYTKDLTAATVAMGATLSKTPQKSLSASLASLGGGIIKRANKVFTAS